MQPKPLVVARIYPGKRRRGRYARLLVFVTKREMRAYVRSTGGQPGQASAMCLDFTGVPDSGLRFAELVFSAGFHGRATEQIAHECLHAVMRLPTSGQLTKAVAGMDGEERFLAYPLGRMVARTVKAIYAVADGLAFERPVGKALKRMRRLAAWPTKGGDA